MQSQALKSRVEQANKQNLRFVYFDITGRGECARIMFHIGNVKFVDERLAFPEFGKQKAEGRFKFNQIPVLYIDGKQYAQSGAINRYAAKLAGLYPEDNREQLLLVEQAYNTVDETFVMATSTMQIRDKEEQTRVRKELTEGKLKNALNNLNKLLIEGGGQYYLGDQISLPDFYAHVLITLLKSGQLEPIPVTITDQFAKLTQNYNAVDQHKFMQSYRNK